MRKLLLIGMLALSQCAAPVAANSGKVAADV